MSVDEPAGRQAARGSSSRGSGDAERRADQAGTTGRERPWRERAGCERGWRHVCKGRQTSERAQGTCRTTPAGERQGDSGKHKNRHRLAPSGPAAAGRARESTRTVRRRCKTLTVCTHNERPTTKVSSGTDSDIHPPTSRNTSQAPRRQTFQPPSPRPTSPAAFWNTLDQACQHVDHRGHSQGVSMQRQLFILCIPKLPTWSGPGSRHFLFHRRQNQNSSKRHQRQH